MSSTKTQSNKPQEPGKKASTGTDRTVANPNSAGSKGFWVALGALVLIGALVIGLIVYNGRGAQADKIAENTESVDGVTMDYSDNTITLTGEGATDTKHASLFEDFSCSYCAELAMETDDEMLQKVKDGELSVDIHPLNFLDGTDDQYKEGHSTRALAATLALAEHGDLQAYWNLRRMLMEQQQQVYNTLDPEQMADLAKDFGASDEAVKDIREQKFLDKAKEIGDANAQYLEENTGTVSSPRVLVDGKDIDSKDLANWIDIVLG